MQEKHLYEYATIRVLPLVEREEFLNVGIILFCKKQKYITVQYTINEPKLSFFSKEVDIEQLKQNLQSFQKIAHGEEKCGPISQMDVPSRFRWLTAIRSSCLQTSRPHPGLCTNLEETAKCLFNQLVL
ncbi:MAG: DUF3037 domain-containing protein [Bacteroidia bacterium]